MTSPNDLSTKTISRSGPRRVVSTPTPPAVPPTEANARPQAIKPYSALIAILVALGIFAIVWLVPTGSERWMLALAASLATLAGVLTGLFVMRRLAPQPDAPATALESAVAPSPETTADDATHGSTYNLQQEIARAKAILRSIADGVVVRDNLGQVIMMNTAAEAMLARITRPGTNPLDELGWTDERADKEETITSQTQRLEIGERVVRARISPVMTNDGDMVGTILVMHDVTRQAATERLKDEFMNHISHELRTPLTVIKGYSDLLRLDTMQARPEAYKKAMGAIFEEAEGLERMITKIIDLSEMTAGTLWLDTRPINLSQFVREALADWEDALREAGLNVQLHTYADDLPIEGDPRRLRWALDALLENACQYCPQGGDLILTTSRFDSAGVLQIKDHGVGISGEDLPHVFKRFYRGSPAGADGSLLDPRGLGQGLYVVKSVVEAHEGRVWVESEPGQGSEFSILLPLVNADSQTSASS